MKDIPRFALILTIVTVIASGSLAWINKITHPVISAQEQKTFNEGLRAVLPGSGQGIIEPVMENDNILYYMGFADPEKTNLIGYAFQAPGQGYSSLIQTLVGMDTSGTILSIKVLSQKETPGLGTKCEEIRTGETTPWWQDQFQGQLTMDLKVDKDGGDIQSITGATITSRAITNAIAHSASSVLSQIQKSNQDS